MARDLQVRNRTRILFVGLLVISAAVSLGAVTVLYHLHVREFLRQAESQAMTDLVLQRKLLNQQMAFIASDLRFLADHNEPAEYLANPCPEALTRWNHEYQRFSQERRCYDQVRFLDTSGMEIVRVDYVDGVAVTIPPRELQDKSTRPYFKDAMALRRGHIYVSPFDLNVEQGKIERPLKPIVRFAMSVYDHKGDRAGMVVLNFLLADFLRLLRESSSTQAVQFMIVTCDGYWVLHPNVEWQWGWLLPDREDKRFQEYSPDAWVAISDADHGCFESPDEAFVFETIDLHVLPSASDPNSPANTPDESAHACREYKILGVISRAAVAAIRQRCFREVGVYWLVWMALSVPLAWAVTGFVVQRSQLRRQLTQRAHFDRVTGLPNRDLFLDRLDQAMRHAERYQRKCALLYLDLDGFKEVNDTLGHEAGDDLLGRVAKRLGDGVRKSDTVARVGGDEFAIVLSEIKSPAEATAVAQKLAAGFVEVFNLPYGTATVGASIGTVLYPDDATDPQVMIAMADRAMYEEKAKHKALRPKSKDRGPTSR